MTPTEQELFRVLVGFASLRPVNSLKWPAYSSIQNIHHFLLHSVLLNPHFSSYPPSTEYQRNFWKWAIENLETAQRELRPEAGQCLSVSSSKVLRTVLGAASNFRTVGAFQHASVDLLDIHPGLPFGHQPPSDSYVTHYWQSIPREVLGLPSSNVFDLSQYTTATLLESRRTVESGTTGLRTWRASFVLAHYLAENPDLIKNRRVLELGSGIGFLGIVVASLQLQHTKSSSRNDVGGLYLTDVNEEVLSRCKNNLILPCNFSSTHPNIHVQELDWFASLHCNQSVALASHLEHELRPDIILGADILLPKVFDPSLIPALVGVLKIALGKENTGGNGQRCAFIALTLRNQVTVEAFLTHVQDANLGITEVSSGVEYPLMSRAFPDEDVVNLFKITTKQ
ncbi:hypothetical protein D9756_005803 [Leucocoprinus leucothites]|uniref:Uncharacterized protein n=1 Tax=Leucocoprinus leucothites TaxID=201217 RepID=A0A8H5D3E9_9AGAR|nr:hypothetical protein D9756_005803 [Leucoagaricus leucothites]